MEKKYRLVTETGRILLGGETYNHNAAERWFDDFNGIYEDEETGSEERIYIEEVQNMEEYYITYNDYFGFCVVEKINGNGKIVFTGSIEDCNRKCIELNSLNQPKRSRSERQLRDGHRGSDDDRPERENMKNLSECKEYYKDLYMDCLENDSFEKSIFESTEKARYETFCETLKFIYGADFENIMPNWSNDASKEFYSRKQSKPPLLAVCRNCPTCTDETGHTMKGWLII